VTTRITTARTSDLVAEQRTVDALGVRVPHGIPVPGGAVPCGAAVAVPATLAEQLRKKTHGRFPSYETDPPVGQDRPSMLSFLPVRTL